METVQHATETLESASMDMEKRVKLLEARLDSFNKKQKGIETEKLTSKLFTLTEEEKKLLAIDPASRHQQMPPIPETPVRMMAPIDPPQMSPVYLKVAGEDSSAAHKLADVMEVSVVITSDSTIDLLLVQKLLDMRGRISGSVATENNVGTSGNEFFRFKPHLRSTHV